MSVTHAYPPSVEGCTTSPPPSQSVICGVPKQKQLGTSNLTCTPASPRPGVRIMRSPESCEPSIITKMKGPGNDVSSAPWRGDAGVPSPFHHFTILIPTFASIHAMDILLTLVSYPWRFSISKSPPLCVASSLSFITPNSLDGMRLPSKFRYVPRT